MSTLQTRRRSLTTITLMGAVVMTLIAAGVLAIFSDRATTGENTLESPEITSNVDLELATVNEDGSCAGFVDDLTTGMFSAEDVLGTGLVWQRVCLRNAGSEATPVALSTLDLVDVDFACTGNESGADDTCGADGVGELSSGLQVNAGASNAVGPCASFDVQFPAFRPDALPTEVGLLDSLTDNETPFIGNLAPGEVTCTYVWFTEFPRPDSQTDRVTWRFAFDGVPATEPTCVDDDLEQPYDIAPGGSSVEGVICAGTYDTFQIEVAPNAAIGGVLLYSNSAGDLDLVWTSCPIDGGLCDEQSMSDSDSSDAESFAYNNPTAETRRVVVFVAGDDLLNDVEPFTISNSYTFSV
jgi:hypothetical protein